MKKLLTLATLIAIVATPVLAEDAKPVDPKAAAPMAKPMVKKPQ